MLNGIDGKFIEKASEDLAFWQESQKGISVRPEHSRRFSRRTVIVSVACTAAVMFGVFFLSLNIGKIEKTDDPANSGVGSDNSSSVIDNSSDVTGDSSDVIGDDPNITSNQNITSAKRYKVDFQGVTEDDVAALFSSEPSKTTNQSGSVTFNLGSVVAKIVPSSGVGGKGTYYSVIYRTVQGDNYDTAAHRNYAEAAANKDWDICQQPKPKSGSPRSLLSSCPREYP